MCWQAIDRAERQAIKHQQLLEEQQQAELEASVDIEREENADAYVGPEEPAVWTIYGSGPESQVRGQCFVISNIH